MNLKLVKLKPKIVNILKEYPISKASVFGSYARGDSNKKSDIDILIDFNGRALSLIELISLEMKLKKALKKKVDLLTYKGISPYLKEQILKEQVRII